MLTGVTKVVLEVGDQDRAKEFWIRTMGCELVQDSPYGGEERWLEVRTPDRHTILVLSSRHADAPPPKEMLPTSNVFFSCDDLQQTYKELSERGVEFPTAPVLMPFGWWSIFADPDGNRYALVPREGHEER